METERAQNHHPHCVAVSSVCAFVADGGGPDHRGEPEGGRVRSVGRSRGADGRGPRPG